MSCPQPTTQASALPSATPALTTPTIQRTTSEDLTGGRETPTAAVVVAPYSRRDVAIALGTGAVMSLLGVMWWLRRG